MERAEGVYSPATEIQSSRGGGRRTEVFKIDIRQGAMTVRATVHNITQSGTDNVGTCLAGFLSISFFD